MLQQKLSMLDFIFKKTYSILFFMCNIKKACPSTSMYVVSKHVLEASSIIRWTADKAPVTAMPVMLKVPQENK